MSRTAREPARSGYRVYPDGVPVRVSRNGGYEPLWSRDGRELFYWQGNAMMAVAVKTDGAFGFSTPVQLFSGRYLTIPSDGARVTMSRATAGSY